MRSTLRNERTSVQLGKAMYGAVEELGAWIIVAWGAVHDEGGIPDMSSISMTL